MRVFVVNDEKDAADLRRRLLRPGVAAERGKAVVDSVRAANPHVDLNQLRPGTVIVLPDHPDLAGDVGDTADIGPGVDQVSAALPRLNAAVRRSAEASNQRTDELRKALQAREVRKAADADERLRAEVDRLAEVLGTERRRAEDWAEAVRAQTEHWQAALAKLKQLG